MFCLLALLAWLIDWLLQLFVMNQFCDSNSCCLGWWWCKTLNPNSHFAADPSLVRYLISWKQIQFPWQSSVPPRCTIRNNQIIFPWQASVLPCTVRDNHILSPWQTSVPQCTIRDCLWICGTIGGRLLLQPSVSNSHSSVCVCVCVCVCVSLFQTHTHTLRKLLSNSRSAQPVRCGSKKRTTSEPKTKNLLDQLQLTTLILEEEHHIPEQRFSWTRSFPGCNSHFFWTPYSKAEVFLVATAISSEHHIPKHKFSW